MVLDTLSVADRANLLDVYARSVMLLDLGQCEAWADLFDSQAVVRTAGGQDGGRSYTGRPELVELARGTFEGRFDLALDASSPAIRSHHILSNVCLYADGAHYARGYAHLLVTTRGEREAPRWLASGIYSDRLSKCGSGCWRFQSRTLTLGGAELTAAALPAASSLRRTG